MFSGRFTPSGATPVICGTAKRVCTHSHRNFSGTAKHVVPSPVARVFASGGAHSGDLREDLTASSTEEERANHKTDLRRIPGIGLKYEALLVKKGIPTVQALTKTFYEDNDGSRDRMVGFLQDQVGIRNKKYATSIAVHLETLRPDEEAQSQSSAGRQKRVTLCVEGNISAGKSTFLRMLSRLQLQEIVEVVPEPVDQWQNVGEKGDNVLQAFYKEPERYAYTFQNYVFVTRMMQNQNTLDGPKPLRLLERSVFSDRMVFVRAVHEAEWMSDMELSIYDSWFNPVVAALPSLVPDGFIYLKADPTICMQRMKQRSRNEEAGVSLEYLQEIHKKHEEWLINGAHWGDRPAKSLFPGQKGNTLLGPDRPLGDKLVLSGMDYPTLPEVIRDKVRFLDSNRHLLHNYIHGVPALVLDCNQDINFQTDTDIQEDFGNQIKAYFEFVRQLQGYKDMHKSSGILSPGMSSFDPNLRSFNLSADPQQAQEYVRRQQEEMGRRICAV